MSTRVSQVGEVCNKLPVRIIVPEAEIPVAMRKFSNAVAVSGVRQGWDCEEERVQCSKLQGDYPDASWFSCLSQFRSFLA